MIRPIAERLVGRGLVWAEGDVHKRQRQFFNPIFTYVHECFIVFSRADIDSAS